MQENGSSFSLKLNENSNGLYTESIIKFQNVGLVNTKHFKNLLVRVSHNKFSIGEKETD